MTDQTCENGWADPDPLTDEQMKAIASIILNWGQLDNFVDLSFQVLSPGKNNKNTDQKLKKISRLSKNHENREKVVIHSKELIKFIEKNKWQRNAIAHGLGLADGEGRRSFYSLNDRKDLTVSQLDDALERSRQACAMAIGLLKLLTTAEPRA